MALLPYFNICPQDLSDPSEPLLCELPSAAVTEAKLVRKGCHTCLKLVNRMGANIRVCIHRLVDQLLHLVPGEIEK